MCYNSSSIARDENRFSRITIMDGRVKFSYSYGSILVGRFWFRRDDGDTGKQKNHFDERKESPV